MVGNQKRARRRRGVLLSLEGWERLQKAKSQLELSVNEGVPFNLETLSELTNLSPHTLIKVRRRESPVDRQTLADYFSAIGLNLTEKDYVKPKMAEQMDAQAPLNGGSPVDSAQRISDPDAPRRAMAEINSTLQRAEDVGAFDPHQGSVRPGGQLPLDSFLYLERPPTEISCYRAIEQPGALLRIKAPRRMGKTSLITRILSQASQRGLRTVFLNLQLADRELFQDLSRFLKWFCLTVGQGLNLSNQLASYWDDIFGSKMSCKIYFEQYLLANQSHPVVLALDDVDQLFRYPELADEFFGLLRAWHEESKNRQIWQHFRLIVAHSTEVYIPLNVNKSPFNVGLPVLLKPLTSDQVDDLARRYGLAWTRSQTDRLMKMTNGQPYLIQMAFYSLWEQGMPFAQLIQQAEKENGAYHDHLQQQYWLLTQDPQLVAAYRQVLQADQPTSLDLSQAFRLESMGLVELHDNKVIPYCSLYTQYFRNRLCCA